MALVPSAIAVWVAAGLVTDVPWGDHLTLFRDTRILEGVALESLFRFHNEHLIVPTRLAVAADYRLWHGANIIPALAALLLTLGIVAVEMQFFRRAEPGLRLAEATFVTAILAAVLLNGRLTWTLTFPILLQHVSANFFVVVTLAAFARLAAGTAGSRPLAWTICLTAAGLAAISSASGIFALPAAVASAIVLAALSPAVRRGPWGRVAAAAAAPGLMIVAGYAAAYAAVAGGGHRPPPDLVQAARFAVYFPGGAWFRDSTWPVEHHPDPLLLHAVVLGFWLAVAGLAWRLGRRRETVGEFELFHLAVLAFVVITAAVGGLFRGGLSDLEALNKKYAPTALLAWAAVASLLVRAVGPWLFPAGGRGSVGPLAVAGLLSAAILPGDFVEFRAWRTWRDKLQRAAVSYAAGDRSDRVLLRFFPDARAADRLLEPIAADGGYCFGSRSDTGDMPAAADCLPLGHRLDRVPDHTDYALEFINNVRVPLGKPPARVSPGEAIMVSGWAVDREAGTAAARVELVVAGRRFRAEHGLSRPDVARHFSQPGFAASGFECLLPGGTLPPGEHEFVLRLVLADGTTFLETPSCRIVVE